MSELKECPFCGHAAIAYFDDVDYFVGCGNAMENCLINPTAFDADQNKAMEIWNTRASLPAVIDHECTRSHPHELMSPICEQRTEIARLRSEISGGEAP